MALSLCYIAWEMKRQRVTVYYSGMVQGVGFRYSVKSEVNGFEVTGTVRNLADGRVELIAEGVRVELEGLLEAIRQSDVGRFIRHEQVDWTDARNEFRTFEIAH
jgi:acylphosphatase